MLLRYLSALLVLVVTVVLLIVFASSIAQGFDLVGMVGNWPDPM